MAERLLYWGLRQGLAGLIVAGTLLTIWSGFSLSFFRLGGTTPLGAPNMPRIAQPGSEPGCCRESRDTLAVWDFYYTAKCSKTSQGGCASGS